MKYILNNNSKETFISNTRNIKAQGIVVPFLRYESLRESNFHLILG